MIGKTISHYKILEKLGEGGMGVVYKAEDTKLRRTVALKFLSQQALGTEDERARFVHEARAAAALNHTNICTVYEIEESEDHSFIAMEYVEGEGIQERIRSGPLNLDMAIDMAIQVAQGLQEAHEKKIVHRDIKPANVMLTTKGQAKIMDFGLAKVSDRTKITKEGTTLGTVAYMSPEQVSGEKVDNRSDIWSLGVVLYEMVVGTTPFKGDYDQAIFYAILNEEPDPPTALRTGVPMELESIINKALAKNPDERYQNVGDMLVDMKTLRKRIESRSLKQPPVKKGKRKANRVLILTCVIAVIIIAIILGRRFISSSAPEGINSIAVLPLESLSGDPEQEYFVDGMTDALITELAKIGELRVTSRTSVMQYKGVRKPLPEIARELGVDAIVEGTVLREGNQVRITAQLIHASTDRHLWADHYDRERRDILALHSEVAQAIAHEIKIAMTPEVKARLASVHPVNPEAHDLYLKGKHHYYWSTKGGAEKAIEYFQQAIKIDPDYAQAYAMLASAYQFLWSRGYLPLDETKSKVETLIKKALEIDDTIAEAHMALARVRMSIDWDWLGAETEFKRAIELNPSLVDARVAYAHHLMAMGRFEESIDEAKLALQLDPVSPITNMNLAYIYRTTRQYDQAIAQYRQMAELEPTDPRPHEMLAWTYEAMERYDDAVRARKKAMTLWGAPPERIAALDSAYSKSGPKGYWMWSLESLKGHYDRNRTVTSVIYAHLGDKDQAFAWLEKAYEEHEGVIYLIKVSPSLDPLRDDPRFQDLLLRMNFPEYETQQ